MRNVTHVVTILELTKILHKTARADVNLHAINPALVLRPEAFDGVHTSIVGRDLLARVVPHDDMVEPTISRRR